MAIQNINGGFSSGLARAGEAIKNAAVWTGRIIKTGFIKFIEGIKACWRAAFPFIKSTAIAFVHFLRTAPGIALIAAGVGTLLSFFSHSQKNNKWGHIALGVASAVSFGAAGAALGIGAVAGFKTPIV